MKDGKPSLLHDKFPFWDSQFVLPLVSVSLSLFNVLITVLSPQASYIKETGKTSLSPSSRL